MQRRKSVAVVPVVAAPDAQEEAAVSSKKSEKRMLTCAALSDLFRRLDRDRSGELDLSEFLSVTKKLHLDATDEELTRFAPSVFL